jgi:hypothetical protein
VESEGRVGVSMMIARYVAAPRNVVWRRLINKSGREGPRESRVRRIEWGGRGHLQRVASGSSPFLEACTDSSRGPPSIFKVWLWALLRHSRRGEREGVSGGAVRRLKDVLDTDREDQGRSAEQGISRGDVCYSLESVDLCDVM